MLRKYKTIFIVTSIFLLFFAIQTKAAVIEGCKFDKARGGDYCPPDDMTPTLPEYCAGQPTPEKPDCCCTYQATLKINSQYDNEGNKIGTTKDKQPILPSIFKVPELSVKIPGLDKFEAVSCQPNQGCSIPWVAQYIGALQRYAIGIIGILAVITLMIGGVIWLTAGGSPEKIGEAKNWIVGSLTGLVLTFGAYLLLYTINPELTILKSINITYIEKIDLEELLFKINNSDSLTKEQADILNSLDTNGLIKHAPGVSKKTYFDMSCDKSMFAGGKAVEFYTTGYWKPGPWENTTKFFCSVGLNCSCPIGKHISDSSCNNGNNKRCPYFGSEVKYCNSNAAGIEPELGTIAADLGCFQKGDKVCLGGKITLTVADAGSAIKGRRFDIWNANNYKGALASTGLASITLGACN